uniref:Uncharacterized protein n=1 Tax=Moniliophthora roreri TaxID=221103 RepID=A0A0W0FRZ8_MONRR
MASPQPAPTQFELELDPGITPRRKPSSGWRFVSWIGVIICVLFISKFIFSVGRAAFDLTQFAHTSVYQNQTWEEVVASESRDAVVRPLIHDTQTFDVVITVWLRRTHEEVEERRIQKDKSPLTDVLNGHPADMPALDFQENRYYLMAYEDDDIYEKPIFSDVVFRGLTLKDKDVGAKVPLQIPTQVFRSPKLSHSDLRASIVLIPTSPSPLDFISDYSTWYPSKVKWPRMKAYPFPLNSSNPPDRGLRDRAIESFAISISLLSFHDTPSSCNEHAATEMSDDIFGSSERDESHGHPDYYGVTDSRWDRFADPSGKHPFVITRTQIRVSDETHLFNRKAYAKKHKELKTASCGQNDPNTTPQLQLCHRVYMENGNWEVLLRARVPDTTNKARSTVDWFYAPYLTHLAASAGPKDLKPVPVTRGSCSDNVSTSQSKPQDQDMMNVAWHVSFSGRSTGKLTVGELWGFPTQLDHGDSDWKKESAHAKSEMINGILGHRYHPDAHPRRKLALKVAAWCMSIIATVLNLSYWTTRTSTVHISVKGTLLLAASLLLDSLIGVVVEIRQNDIKHNDWISLIVLFVKTLLFKWILPLLMVRIAGRFVFLGKDGVSSWIPRRIRANHRERASARLDEKTSIRLVAALLAGLILLYVFIDPNNLFIISPLQIIPTYEDVPEPFIRVLVAPLKWTGNFCQMTLNERSGVFAGSYRLTIFVRVIEEVLRLALLSERAIGRDDSRWGLSMEDAIRLMILAGFGWQAVRLSRHAVDEDGEKEDSL